MGDTMADTLKFVGIAGTLVAALMMGGAGEAQAAKCQLLLGGAENPPVVSQGTGSFRVTKVDANTLNYTLVYDIPDAEVTAAHIHIANPSINGGISAFLCTNIGGGSDTTPACPSPSGEVEGTITADDVLAVDPSIEAGDLAGLFKLIQTGATYANVHTTDHTDGEIRCQINPKLR